jgi:hypothetical protein
VAPDRAGDVAGAEVEEAMTELERYLRIGWQGRLQDHEQTCEHCDGTGGDPDDLCPDGSEPPDQNPCPLCDGGEIRWGSFYVDDTGPCDDCGELGVWIAAMYEPGCIEYVCFPCYVRHHHRDCGCDRWRWAEGALGLEPPR